MRTEITTVIFSKNRACQLELLLRGLSMPAVVQYTCDKEFEAGYKKVMEMYPHISFVKEEDFKKNLLDSLVSDYTMFLVDDDVMINTFDEDCPEFLALKSNEDILCLSLRMCSRYRRNPITTNNNTWAWSGQKKSWGYPMSVSSTVFRTKDILSTIKEKDINMPNSLEIALRKSPPDRPLMVCFDVPKVVNNLANQVQTVFKMDTMNVSLEELEKRFLGGERLSLGHIKEVAKTADDCFIKTNYQWETI